MCLIFTHHPDTELDEEWIANFWGHNSDGIGVMFADTTEEGLPFVNVIKTIAKDENEAWAFYRQHIKGRKCVVHFRMATHGDVTEDQVHPYTVAEDAAGRMTLGIMHNGVLACGNSFDKTKSDTWHFTRWFLKPLLADDHGGHADLLNKSAFIDMLGTYIGDSNRFVFMDDTGEVTIVNEHEGVRWRGMWLANTYAWDSPSHLSKYNRARKDEKHTLADDLLDRPPRDWRDWQDAGWWNNYRDFKEATPASKGAVVVAANAPAPSNDTTKVVVASNGTGKEISSAKTSFGKKNVKNWMLNQFDSMFDMLKQEQLNKAWSQLTYNDMAEFEDSYDLDQLWDAIYMGVDGIVPEDRLVEIIKNPKQYWSNEPARIRGIGASVLRREGDGEPGFDDPETDSEAITDPGDEEVIEATLPRHPEPELSGNEIDLGSPADHNYTEMPDLLPDGRPVFDNKEVF